jgi:hypothetical protein
MRRDVGGAEALSTVCGLLIVYIAHIIVRFLSFKHCRPYSMIWRGHPFKISS